MKLRTTKDSIRLRLSRSDVRAFAETGRVRESVKIGPGELSYELVEDDLVGGLSARFAENCLTIRVPKRQADEWIGTEMVGIQASDSGGLKILVEKDFACLSPRSDDDKDSFPNPASRSAHETRNS